MRLLLSKNLSPIETQGILTGVIAPRPIALVSTISENGVNNLAPFSFFNAFGSNPPFLAFSPSRRGRDGSLKDTYRNLVATEECVVHVVTFSMAEQVNLASGEYDWEVDEFQKSGFTPIPSTLVKAMRVKESPVHMECRLHQMIHLGDGPASGNLALCEILCFHIQDEIYKEDKISVREIDQIGRNGGKFYTRAHGDALFELTMPQRNIGIGFDALPTELRDSALLTTRNKARLASEPNLPSMKEAKAALSMVPREEGDWDDFEECIRFNDLHRALAIFLYISDRDEAETKNHILSLLQLILDENQASLAWQVFLTYAPSLKK